MLPTRTAPNAVLTDRKEPFSEFVRTMLENDSDTKPRIVLSSVSTSTVPSP
jgi:hypothetical protein